MGNFRTSYRAKWRTGVGTGSSSSDSQPVSKLWYEWLTNVVAVYQPVGAASLAASYVNIVNPGTYNAAAGVDPTWSASTGWTFNGTTQYLTTGITEAGGSPTWTFLVCYSGTPASNRCAFGATYSNGGCEIRPVYGTDVLYTHGNGFLAAPALTGLNVLGFSGSLLYRNGVYDGDTGAFTSAADRAIYIGAQNTGSASNFFNANIRAFVVCSSTQSAAQIYQASIGMLAL